MYKHTMSLMKFKAHTSFACD